MTQKSAARLAKDELEKNPPREMKEIDAEYNHTCGLAGQAQYVIEVRKAELENFNRKLYALNQEAARRREYDELQLKKTTSSTISEETATDVTAS